MLYKMFSEIIVEKHPIYIIDYQGIEASEYAGQEYNMGCLS